MTDKEIAEVLEGGSLGERTSGHCPTLPIGPRPL